MKRLCIIYTPYAMFLYLLHCTPEQILNTYYVIRGHDSSLSFEQLGLEKGHVYIFHRIKRGWQLSYLWVLNRIEKWLKIPRIAKDTEIFAEVYSDVPGSVIIGRHSYTLIEHAPHIFDQKIVRGGIILKSGDHTLRRKIKAEVRGLARYVLGWLYGPTFSARLGHNRYCKVIISSVEVKNKALKDKEHIRINFTEAWKSASKRKKQLVLQAFNVKDSDLAKWRQKDILFISQNLSCHYSTELQRRVVAKILSHYPKERVLIKLHPRDRFDYASEFPGYEVMDTKAPEQLLDALGLRFTKAVTAFSTAAFTMPKGTEVDWFGTEVDEKIFQRLGHIEGPAGSHNIF